MCKMSKLFFGMALFLVACGEEGTSEPLEYPEDSSAEICSSSENATISVSSDSEGFSSSEDLAKSSSSDARSCSSLTESSSSFSSSSALSSSSLLVLPCKTEMEDHCEYGALYDERDGQTYKTVRIGNQIWMAENLNYAYLQPTATLDSSSRCENNDPDSCAKYGRLYIWSAAIDSAAVFSSSGKGFGDGAGCGNMERPQPCGPELCVRGICPTGWHLPTEDEWDELLSIMGGLDLNGTIDYGFYSSPQNLTDFWASGADEIASAYSARCTNTRCFARWKNDALPIRCLKDTIIGLKDVRQGLVTDERDGQAYKTMTIKNQTWMMQNLNYEQADGSFCYDDEDSNCLKYGRLYTWGAAMDSAKTGCGDGKICEVKENVQGACPVGWHLPSKEEFELLERNVNSIENTLFYSLFHLLLGPFSGLRLGKNNYMLEGEYAFFLSSTEVDGEEEKVAYCLQEPDNVGFFHREINYCTKKYAWSVRCVKDVPD